MSNTVPKEMPDLERRFGGVRRLYGSDALAGVVSFRTLDPEALLARSSICTLVTLPPVMLIITVTSLL